MEFEFEAKLWEWDGKGAWVFVTLPNACSSDVKELSDVNTRKGFGSVKVEVVSGKSIWRTSVFPDSKSGCYLLPVKKAVRQAEGLMVGEVMKLRLRTLDF